MQAGIMRAREQVLLLLGELRLGSRLPGERVLSERFGVSRMTLRAAMDILIEEGLIFRSARSGTFVVKPITSSGLSLKSFSNTMTDRGFCVTSRVISFKEIKADKNLAETLRIKTHSVVFKATRVRYGNDTPISIEELYLSKDLVPDLNKSVLTGSLYTFLKERHDIVIKTAENRISAHIPNEAEMKLLQIDQGVPTLRMRVIDADQNGNIVMKAICHYRSDLYNLNLHLDSVQISEEKIQELQVN
jgi:GntR family transcriptional regulator